MSEPEQFQTSDAEQLVSRLNALVEEIESYPDAGLRDKALDLVQMIMELYGEALRRTLDIIASLPDKDQALPRLLSDEIIRAMLLIHGLMPVDLESRVAAALEQMRPYLISQNADAKLIAVEDGRARLHLIRKGSGAPPVAVLQQQIEEALSDAAPDLAGVEIEGLAGRIQSTAKAASVPGSSMASRSIDEEKPPKLVQLKRPAPAQTGAGGSWVAVIRAGGMEDDRFRVIEFGDVNLLVCRIRGELYAYRNGCAEGGRRLDDALFESPMLTCICHGYRYDLRRAGACLERPELRLASLPVRIEDEKVKVLIPDAR